jgi:hypothetical protein
MIKSLVLISSMLLLSACFTQEPGAQCLSSFKSTLKDPDSGKVVSFNDPTLIYTATNSYGARIQGKALCVKYGDKWVRDTSKEYLMILNLTTNKMEKSNDCRRAGGSARECAGDSLALKLSANSRAPLDQNMLNKEAKEELGF